MKNKMTRRKFTETIIQGMTVATLCPFINCADNSSGKKEHPNIVLILMDDLGWPSLGCYGNQDVPTPHLDQLASEGLRFTDAYVTPQCTPTRASLLTGQYTARNGLWHVLPRYGYPFAAVEEPEFAENLSPETALLSRVLHENGYATACIGKWHLHSATDGDYERLYPEAAARYGFDQVLPDDQTRGCHKGEDECVDYLIDESIKFIEKNQSRPFFVYLPHYAVHRKVRAPQDLVQKYRERGYPEKGVKNATYLAAIEHFDRAIGRLLTRLDELRLTENTVVIFLSDNGGVMAEFPNTPLRYGKGTIYEGGIRVPFILRWPGHVAAGKTCSEPVHVVDLFPTLAALSNSKIPENHVLDGVDLAPLFSGEGTLARDAIFTYAPLYDHLWGATPGATIRQGNYKLIEFFGDYVDLENNATYIPEGRLELYDLSQDLGEQENLAVKMPELTAKLRQQLHEWIRSTGAVIPGRNPDYDPARVMEKRRGAR